MSKKTLLVIIILVALVILGVGIYLLFFTKPLVSQTTPNGTYSPFGNYSGSSSTTPNVTATSSSSTVANSTSTYSSPTAVLIKISSAPIAGAGSYQRKITSTTTTDTIVRYTDRATGHTMDYDTNNNSSFTASNTTIPTIYNAWWSGSNLLAQFLDQDGQTIKTYVGSLSTAATSTLPLSGSFLTNNVYALAISPKTNRIFYITAGGSAVGTISNIDGTKKNQFFNFPFNEWNTEWPNESTITLTTKASYNTAGYMYFLSSTKGTMTKALGDINGLTTRTSPSLNYTIYSGSTNGGLATAVYDFKHNTSYTLNNPTLPEKCVWSTLKPSVAYCAIPINVGIGNYPDDWYQGNVSFVDNIYKIDMTLPSAELLYSLPQDQNIDATNLFLDQQENHLYFTNKNDYNLWGLNIANLVPTI